MRRRRQQQQQQQQIPISFVRLSITTFIFVSKNKNIWSWNFAVQFIHCFVSATLRTYLIANRWFWLLFWQPLAQHSTAKRNLISVVQQMNMFHWSRALKLFEFLKRVCVCLHRMKIGSDYSKSCVNGCCCFCCVPCYTFSKSVVHKCPIGSKK